MPRFLIAIDDDYMTHLFPQYGKPNDRTLVVDEREGMKIRHLEMVSGTPIPFLDAQECPLERVVYESGMVCALGFRPDIVAGINPALYGGWPTEVGVIAFTEQSHSAMQRETQAVGEVPEGPFPYVVVRFNGDPLQFKLYQSPHFNTRRDNRAGMTIVTPLKISAFLKICEKFLARIFGKYN